ncbi:MAG TPA: hypothetical protein DEF82_05110 [Crocinitomicaceae bacterium]|nr:DUF2490 domain-containing protein [Flavobacteriales bacterium]HBW86123.1 hypothetical protein [Crocinitomicaceae bacterium]
MFRSLSLLVFLFLGLYSHAQTQKDAIIWTTLSLEKKFTKRLYLNLINQTAINQNVTELGSSFIDFGLQYKVNSYFATSANYRFIKLRNLNNEYDNLQRFYLDLIGSKGFGNFYLQFRSRFQNQLYGLNIFDTYKPNKYFIRNKLSVRYSVDSKNSINASIEQFYRLNTVFKTQFIRTSIGYSYKLNLYHKIDLSYTQQFGLNTKTPKILFIYNIGYTYKF